MASIAAQIPEDQKIWLAVRTKFRSEKYVVRQLEDKGIHAFVPLQENVRRYGGRIRKSQVPLINTYIFVQINRAQYVPVLDTPYALYFISVGDQMVEVTEEEINLMKRLTGEKVEAFETLPQELEVGDEVKIISGHLTGMNGRLVDFKNKKKLLVKLDSIGFQMLVEIPVESVYR
jgi:transcription antitermination factor NusG